MVLREEVLMEIPMQVKSFYKMKGISPKQIKLLDPYKLNLKKGET